jgi:predicted DNA-binding transcriptional regulator AlpA
VLEVADLLSVSESTVWGLARDRELVPIRLRQRVTRWRRADVLGYLDRLTRKAEGVARAR